MEMSLPTEAQWEYACRAGSDTEFYFGDSRSELDNHAWHVQNSGDGSNPVGQKKANPWGLYDMYGNAYEWCRDWHGPYSPGPVVNPKGPETGNMRILRGGCRANKREREVFRSADRWSWYPEYDNTDDGYCHGFRCVRKVE
jgi:formylglycine-generating enzyme required for sulfatase activity